MNIAIVDDRIEETDSLVSCLKEYAAIHHIEISFDRFTSAEQLLTDYRPLRYTLIFMDIYMDGLSGIEAAESIRKTDQDTLLVFLTASEDHRAEAFHCHAYDYLSKPYKSDEIFRILDHILRLNTEQESSRFFFSCDRKQLSLRYADIVYLETDKNYIILHDPSGEAYRIRKTFSAVQEELSQDPRFLTILRGLMVNMDYVKRIDHGVCRLTGDIQFPVNVRHTKSLQQLLNNYHFAKIRKEAFRKGSRQ